MTSNVGKADANRGVPGMRVQLGPICSPVTAAHNSIDSCPHIGHELGLSTPHSISRFISTTGFLGSAITHSYHPEFPFEVITVFTSGQCNSLFASPLKFSTVLDVQHTSGCSTADALALNCSRQADGHSKAVPKGRQGGSLILGSPLKRISVHCA